MKRKLAINIVYTLVFYCKEEILAVKENIIDFLNMLKEDPIDEVKEVCLQTLKFIEENDPSNEENKNNDIKSNTRKNENEKPRNVFNKNKNKNNKKNDIINNNYLKNNNKSGIGSGGNKKKNNDGFAEKIQKEKEFLEKLEKNNNNSNLNDSFGNTINGILQQLKKIQEDQSQFLNIVNNIQKTVDNNFTTLNERVMNLEKKAGIKSNFNMKSNLDNNISSFNSNNLNNKEKENEIKSNNNEKININNNQNINANKNKKIKILSKKEEQNKIDELKKKFVNGKYNEVLIESKENDNYLFKLLPFMDKNIIPKIEIVILEDIINRLNKKISIICLGTGRANINDILTFYIQLTKSKVNLKLITQLSIKDTLKFLKAKSNNKLIQNDINNIDTILKALKV
jgi:hypothetical protein